MFDVTSDIWQFVGVLVIGGPMLVAAFIHDRKGSKDAAIKADARDGLDHHGSAVCCGSRDRH